MHLLDGGLSDNIGLRGPYVALSGQDSAWSLYTKINQGKVTARAGHHGQCADGSRPQLGQA